MHLPAVSARLVSATIPGPAGPLEALLRIPDPVAGAAVMAHPHPLHGGTMHTKVVHAAAKLFADRFGLLTVRFNFRGVGASAGAYDEGRGETDDVVAAAAFARSFGASEDSGGRAGVGGTRGELQAPPVPGPFVLGGFSFGSLCALRAQPRVNADALLLVGIPLERMDPAEVTSAGRARVVWVHGSADEVAPPAGAAELAARAGWELAFVPGADHFFTGKLAEFEAAAEAGLRRALGEGP